MWHEDDVARLVKSIYAAPMAADGWSLVLNNLASHLGASRAQLFVTDFWAKGVPLSDLNPRDPDALSGYVDHFAQLDPRSPFACRADGQAHRREEMVPDDVFERSEIYNDFLVPYEAEQSMLLSLRGLTPTSNFLTIMRTEKDGPFDEDACRLLNILEPHIHQALQLQKRMTALGRVVRVQDEALESLGVGVILLEVNGCAIHVNAAAEAILAQRDGLSLSADGHCRAADSNANSELSRLTSEATKTSFQNGLHAGGTLALSRPSGRRPFRVTVTPLHYERVDLGTAPVVVAVTITDPERRAPRKIDFLAQHYGLTKSEARLAASFLETASLQQSAEALRITEGTARQYLKRIFHKTETRNQAELMRLLLSWGRF